MTVFHFDFMKNTNPPLIKGLWNMSSAREMNAVRRERRLKEAGIVRQVPPPKANPDFTPTEFNLPDEDRQFPIGKVKVCPECRLAFTAKLDRYHDGVCQRYRVKCGNPNCLNQTPDFKTSQEAIQCWQVTAAMMQPT